MAYLDGELDAANAAAIHAHVAHCDRCRHAHGAMHHLIAAVHASQLPALAPRRLRLTIAQLFATR